MKLREAVPRSILGSTARQGILTLCARVTAAACYLLMFLVINHTLGAQGLGRFVILVAWMTFCVVAASIGVPRALTVLGSKHQDSIPELNGVALLLSLTLGCIAFLLTFAALQFVSKTVAFSFGTCLLISLSSSSVLLLQVMQSLLMSQLRYGWFASTIVLQRLSFLVLGLIVWALNPQFSSFILVFSISQAITAIFATVALLWQVAPARRPPSGLIRTTTGLGLRCYGASLAEFANYRLDQLMLTVLASTTAIAVYSMAVQSTELLLLGINSMLVATFTTLLRMSGAESQQFVSRTIQRLLRIGAPLALVVGIGAAVVLPVVFGRIYLLGSIAAIILATGSIPFAIGQMYTYALTASSRAGLASVAQLLALSVVVPGVFVSAKLSPVIGTAVVAWISYAVLAIASWLLYRRGLTLQNAFLDSPNGVTTPSEARPDHRSFSGHSAAKSI